MNPQSILLNFFPSVYKHLQKTRLWKSLGGHMLLAYLWTLCWLEAKFGICWWSLQTIWTQIRSNKMSGLIWIQVYDPLMLFPKIFWSKSNAENICWRQNYEKLPGMQNLINLVNNYWLTIQNICGVVILEKNICTTIMNKPCSLSLLSTLV